MHSACNSILVEVVVTMGYSWLITARSDYPCLQHARANTGREVMGGGYNYSFLGLFWVCLLFCSCWSTLIVVW